jgi:hypothetical protein
LPDWVGVGFIRYASVGDEDIDGSMAGFGLRDAGLDGGFRRDVSCNSEEIK